MSETTTTTAVDTTTTTAADTNAAAAAVVDSGAAAPAAGSDTTAPAPETISAFAKGVEEQRVADGVAKPTEVVDDAAKTEQAKADAAKKAEAEADPVEAEIATLGLKEKTAERFRELSKRPTDADVAPLREKAERFDNWDHILRESTARPEQLANALGYLQLINSGDPVAMNKAYDSMMQEITWLGRQLGREAPGAYDPLSDHGDLKAKVDQAEMTREAALEVARSRATTARAAERDNRTTAEQRAKAEHEGHVNQALVDLGTLTTTLRTADPHFDAKLESLKPLMGVIRESVHPSQWVAAIKKAYLELPNPKPAAAPAPVGPQPIRPTGGAGGQARKFNAAEISAGAPFLAGVATAR